MKINLVGYTKVPQYNGEFNLDKALEYCAKMGGICYMKDSFETILNEPSEVTQKRLSQVLSSGHHSVFDHFKLTLEFKEIPKILAIILNNEKDYVTSEKSARYTNYVDLPESEKELYFKWYEKLQPIIKNKYPQLYNENAKSPMLKIEKLAQENARYFVSIFTPGTTMGYTTSLRQLNYLIYMFKDYITNCEQNNFNKLLVPYMQEFIDLLNEYTVPDLIPKGKNRRLSIFGDERYKNMPDIYSYVYQASFKASYSFIAQSQRHRSEHTFMYNLDDFEFYIPEILEDESLKNEWLQDALKIKDRFPQGILLKIVQTGNIDTLLLKSTERVCGAAQLEIMRHTVDLLNKFKENSIYGNIITEFTNNKTARCKFKNGSCNRPCMLASNQFERKI